MTRSTRKASARRRRAVVALAMRAGDALDYDAMLVRTRQTASRNVRRLAGNAAHNAARCYTRQLLARGQ